MGRAAHTVAGAVKADAVAAGDLQAEGRRRGGMQQECTGALEIAESGPIAYAAALNHSPTAGYGMSLHLTQLQTVLQPGTLVTK